VFIPQRVISLDKKTVKAGGLAASLKGGAIVKPSDEMDAGKTYYLVGFAAE
jgi:hypothetical protein